MPQKKKRKVFVTGASGFVGANLVRLLLKRNYEVHILNRTNTLSWRLTDIKDSLHIYQGDITHYTSVKKALQQSLPDYIIHLATYGAYHYQTELEKIIDVNIVGTKNLLEASKKIPYSCFINTGSSSEYGIKNKPMKENDFCEPISYYAATKLAATNICRVFAKQQNKPIVTLRLFSVYGPYEEPGRLVPTILQALIQKNPINLTSGKQRRDFIFVDDVSTGYLKAFQLGNKIRGEVFNIGTGKEYTNDEIVRKLFTITNDKTIIKRGTYQKRSWDTPHWRADTGHSKKVLNWTSTYTIDKGLERTYSWFTKNIHLYS